MSTIRCGNCNAPIDDMIDECGFCHTVTEHGRKARAERIKQEEAARRESDKRAQQQAAITRSLQIQEARTAATRSLLWSLVGMFACCLPLGPIVGIVMARRARELALKHGVETTQSTVGFVVGVVTLLICLGLWVGVAISGKMESDRKVALKAMIERGASEQPLTSPTACALAELELLEAKYEAFSYLNHDFECPGQLTGEGDDVALIDGYFTKEGKRVPVIACFHRGAKWSVKQLRGDERCTEPPPEPAAPVTEPTAAEKPRKRK